MSELQGQTNITDYLPDEATGSREQATAEGYDAEGRLLDYVVEGTADARQATRDGTQRESAGRARTSSGPAGHLPQGGRLMESDWHKVAKLVRVAVGNTKTAEDYIILRVAAEQEYRPRRGGRLSRLAEKLLAIYALTVYRAAQFFDWEESRWRES
jgi:hypothetical protein